MEPNPEKRPISLAFREAEIIFTRTGTFVTYQVNAKRLEDVERYIAYRRGSGDKVGKPGIIDPATKEVVPLEEVENSLSDALPTVVFLTAEIEVESPYKFSSS